MAAVALTNAAWTPLWLANPNRSFAAVLGGTGVEGDTIFVTDDPSLNPGDPGVAEFRGIRGAMYFETRGVNALYARTNLADPLVVRTTTTIQVSKSPMPGGLICTRDYRILTETGGGEVTYLDGDAGVWAPVLPYNENRLRATIMGDMDNVMIAQKFADPSVVSLLVPTVFQSAGPAFPGPLVLEGPDDIEVLDFGNVGKQENVWWIRDVKEAI
jgi:hypothetical protein